MRTAIIASSLFLTLLPAAAQKPPDPPPAFEVATIKPSYPSACCSRTFSRDGRHFATTNTNLRYLIQYAYNLQAKQITGGPAWIDVDRFDVVGVIDGVGEPNDRQWKVALQNLLTDRFHLQLHHDTAEMSAYALTIAKGGPKLTKSDGGSYQRMGFSGAVGQTMNGMGVNATIADFAGELQRIVLDRPIVDRTGLTGTFSIEFAFTREDPQTLGMGPPLPDNAAPTLFTAIQQQLGLKLEPTKAPVDILVIDHAEKPSAN
jgi:uncharacterized protein (TIGR03435 family)